MAEEQDQKQKLFGFWLGERHPVYDVITTKLPRERKPYAYFVRVPDLPAFLNTIKPILESRLANSAFANHTGTIKLSFYRDGLSLDFKQGRLEEIKALAFDELDDAVANFPPLVIFHLVFGYRTVEELKHILPDCTTKDDETINLLNALFPKKASQVWEVS